MDSQFVNKFFENERLHAITGGKWYTITSQNNGDRWVRFVPPATGKGGCRLIQGTMMLVFCDLSKSICQREARFVLSILKYPTHSTFVRKEMRFGFAAS